MRVVVAIDSFKGSLSSLEAAAAAREGILRAQPGAEVLVLPLADGGEGTTEALTAGLGGELVELPVTGPLGAPVPAHYGLIPHRGMAILEMSQAAGLPLVPPERRCPLHTTTLGVGEMLLDALDRDCREIILGIGGSATNDGGLGMLTALGCVFRDGAGRALEGYGRDVEQVASIDPSGLDPRLADCHLRVACDVTNPLCGENGCSAVYGPQKGATPQVVRQMDAALDRFARQTAHITGRDLSSLPGAGAAGGLGFALAAYLGAQLVPGVSLVLDAIGFREAVSGADWVVTGEGRLDGQTAMGKAPVGAAALAKEAGCRVVALCGCATEDAELCNHCGIDAFFPILHSPMTVEEAMEPHTARRNLSRTAQQVFRLLK